MVNTINNVRSVDTTTLKSHIADYVAVDPHKKALDPPIVNTNRDQMGLKHPILARLICPVEVLAELVKNPVE